MSTTSAPIAPQPICPRLQFSLRTLLALRLVLGAAFGWLGRHVQRARTERLATTAIEQLGGDVEYGNVSVFAVSLARAPISDAELTHLRELTQLKSLSLNNTQISDAGLAHLRRLCVEKGGRSHLPERPGGCFAQMSPAPFFSTSREQ